MKKRKDQLVNWLRQFFNENEIVELKAMVNDASFRKYYRIWAKNKSYVIMDAPLDKEKPDVFFRVSRLLEHYGVAVPRCFEYNQEEGFLLISDFGDGLFSHYLLEENMEMYYQKALNVLQEIQEVDANLVPDYEYTKFMTEQMLFIEWYLKYINYVADDKEINELQRLFALLAKSACEQPKVFVHRDFHSRNIIVKKDQSLGIIDYQDAVRGPVTYDLVSLLKDCYIDWPREKILPLVIENYHALRKKGLCQDISSEKFIEWFDLMGLQRHIKCLGIFTRVYLRNNRDGYLKELPRVRAYILDVVNRYDCLSDYKTLIFRILS